MSPIPAAALPTPDLTGEVTLTLAPPVHYSNPGLGFAVDYSADWEVVAPPEWVDPLAQVWSAIEFRTNLYGHGQQVFGKYVVTVAVSDSQGRSLTETLEYNLSPIVPSLRDGIESTCCLTVGGDRVLPPVLRDQSIRCPQH